MYLLHLCPPPQAWAFLSQLPVVEVSLGVQGWWEDSPGQTQRPLPARGSGRRDGWLDVHADQEYVLLVSLRRINTAQQRVGSHTHTHLTHTHTLYTHTHLIHTHTLHAHTPYTHTH